MMFEANVKKELPIYEDEIEKLISEFCRALEDNNIRAMASIENKLKRVEADYEKTKQDKALLRLMNDSDYIVNPQQMEKLLAIRNFFLDLESDLGASAIPIDLIPSKRHGGITATFPVFDVYGDQVARFCSVMSGCSAITIDPIETGVCISCTVPDVFIRKEVS